jgi:phosphoribosylformylglycinamidine (FGAM) synthase-like amidotransferase family enzyme
MRSPMFDFGIQWVGPRWPDDTYVVAFCPAIIETLAITYNADGSKRYVGGITADFKHVFGIMPTERRNG